MHYSIILTALLSSITAVFFTYLDAKLFDAPKSKFTYFKIMVLTALIACSVVYFMQGGNSQIQVQQGGTGLLGTRNLGAPFTTVDINGAPEQIMTGLPPF
jgi:hypothetical protein